MRAMPFRSSLTSTANSLSRVGTAGPKREDFSDGIGWQRSHSRIGSGMSLARALSSAAFLRVCKQVVEALTEMAAACEIARVRQSLSI